MFASRDRRRHRRPALFAMGISLAALVAAADARAQARDRDDEAVPLLPAGVVPPPQPGAAPETVDQTPQAGADPETTGTIAPTARRRLRPPEDDPFAAPGAQIGAFVLRGRLDAVGGYDSNPRRTTGGKGSAYGTIGGEVSLESDWVRHQAELRAQGSYTHYSSARGLNAPVGEATARGRLDVTRALAVDAEGRVGLATLEPGDPDTPDALASRPLTTSLRAAAGVTYNPQPWSVRLGGSVERELFEDGRLQSGAVYDTGDRVNTTYGLELRGSYQLSPRLEPFVETSVERRLYDRRDPAGISRDSDGLSVAAGIRAEPSPLLSAEARLGYRWRRYNDPALKDLGGLLADVSLTWTPTALTTVTATAATELNDTLLAGASGSLGYTGRLEVAHELRRNVAVTAAGEFSRTEYNGLGRTDDRWSAELGLDWRFNRHAGLRTRVAHTRLRSTVPGQDYTAMLFETGLRFRY